MVTIHDPFSSLFAVDQSQPIRGFIFFASGFGHVMMQVLNMLGHYEGYFIIKKLQKMMIPSPHHLGAAIQLVNKDLAVT